MSISKQLRVLATWGTAVTFGIACRSEPEIRADKPATTADPIDSTAEAGPVTPDGCPAGLKGPSMVRVTTPEGKGYCIDQREVTQGEYFEFLYAYLEDPTVSSKRKEGAPDWPKAPGCEIPRLMPDFIGDIDCDTTPDAFSQKNMRQHHPIACVNWCNAYSYCAWAGKRLCGRVGGSDGDASNASGLADANQSEFYNVCSQGGKTAYAYGDDYRADIMSSGDIAYYKDGYAPDRAAAEADAPTDCHGAIAPFDAVVNVGCNVAEWQDGCNGSAYHAICVAHGAAASGTPADKRTRCDAFLEQERSQRSPQIGFRCCHD